MEYDPVKWCMVIQYNHRFYDAYFSPRMEKLCLRHQAGVETDQHQKLTYRTIYPIHQSIPDCDAWMVP